MYIHAHTCTHTPYLQATYTHTHTHTHTHIISQQQENKHVRWEDLTPTLSKQTIYYK